MAHILYLDDEAATFNCVEGGDNFLTIEATASSLNASGRSVRVCLLENEAKPAALVDLVDNGYNEDAELYW